LRDSNGRTPNRSEGVTFPKVTDTHQLSFLHSFFDRGLNNDIHTRYQTLDELEIRLKNIIGQESSLPRPNFQNEAKHHIEVLFRVDRVNRYSRYRAALAPLGKALDKHLQELARSMEGFYLSWSQESERHNESVRQDIVWIYETRVAVQGHQRGWKIKFLILEEATECVLKRSIERQQPDGGSPINIEEIILFRYLPPALPHAELMISDIEQSILRAMEGLNKEIENLGANEKPLGSEEGAKIFKKIRENLAAQEVIGTRKDLNPRAGEIRSWDKWIENIEISVTSKPKTSAKRIADLFAKVCRDKGLDIQRDKKIPLWDDSSRTTVISSGIELVVFDPRAFP